MKERPKITRPEDLQLLAGLTLRAELRLETVSAFGLVAVSVVDSGGVGGLCLIQGAKVFALDQDGAFRSVELDFESLGPLCGPRRLSDAEGTRLALLEFDGLRYLARRWTAQRGGWHAWQAHICNKAPRVVELQTSELEQVVAAAISKNEEPRRPVAGSQQKSRTGAK